MIRRNERRIDKNFNNESNLRMAKIKTILLSIKREENVD